MKSFIRVLILSALLLSPIYKLDAQTFIWGKRIYGNVNCNGISVDTNGNSYIIGGFNGTAIFDTIKLTADSLHGGNLFIAKYNPNGKCLWSKQAGSLTDDHIYSITTDINGNSYIVGYFTSAATFDTIKLTCKGFCDIFIAKYNTDGNCLWVKQAGGENASGNGISIDKNGYIYICGDFFGTASFDTIKLNSPMGLDIFVAKCDPNGNFLWVKQAGGSYWDIGFSLAVDSYSNSYVTGYFQVTSPFDSIKLTSYGGLDIFIAKYDPNGNCQWAKQAGGTADDWGQCISIDNIGNNYITGNFYGAATFEANRLISNGLRDIFIAKYGPNGDCLWAKNAGGISNDDGRSISIDAYGYSYITGGFQGNAVFDTFHLTSFGNDDIYIAKYSPNGDCLWVNQAGGLGDDQGFSISVDKYGNIYTVGNFTDTAKFGAIQLCGAGAFITKIRNFPVSIKNEINPLLNYYLLHQNFPNPFNPTTNIKFSLPKSTNVTLAIYNTLGQESTKLISKNMSAGTYTTKWDASGFASGVYYYRIVAGDFVQTKKLILLK